MLGLSDSSFPDTGYEVAGLVVVLAFFAWIAYLMYRD